MKSDDHYIEKETYKGYEICISFDQDPESPREWDNLGTLACYHRRYQLGDEDVPSMEEVQELSARPDVISLPVFLYDHSGLRMSIWSFQDHWDSGQVGCIYTLPETVREEYGLAPDAEITPEVTERVVQVLSEEVIFMDRYLSGEVYGYEIYLNDELQHSCWGFYMDSDRVLRMAKESVDSLPVVQEQLNLFSSEEE